MPGSANRRSRPTLVVEPLLWPEPDALPNALLPDDDPLLPEDEPPAIEDTADRRAADPDKAESIMGNTLRLSLADSFIIPKRTPAYSPSSFRLGAINE
jgi:hypothetical protein